MSAVSASENFNYGFPSPGPQHPNADKVMNHVFFTNNTDWKTLRETAQFDYIVIGTGFCSYAFCERTLKNNPNARILVLERGGFFLAEHFQNLPMPYKHTLGGLSETFPWTLSLKTHEGKYIKWQHGMVPFFGGRSIMWSAWCPRPTVPEMDGWPKEMIERAHRYFPEAERLLNVVPADELDKGDKAPAPGTRPIYGVMQAALTERMKKMLGEVESATRTMAAPLAVGAPLQGGIDFSKYATPGPMLALIDRQETLASQNKGAPLRVVTNCVVEKILQQEINGQSQATAIQTSLGMVNVGDAKIILGMGTLPATTLVQNSFPQVKNAGKRFTSHFISSIVARVPRADYDFANQLGDLELAAIYMAGMNKQSKEMGQYHIQLSVLSDKNPIVNAQTALRHMPDVVSTASMPQLLSSKDYLVFVCAVLGELDYRNPDSWFLPNGGEDPTTNVTLQVLANQNDEAVWDTMDEGTFQALERILSPKGAAQVEYWHANSDGVTGTWEHQRPPQSQIRVPALVHEASTMWIGEDSESPVRMDYRPQQVENVYVTGASLWPTGASWNPTMTMVAFAQDLADRLSAK
jgi:choline dehydrogenase-like flavoprotein